MTSIDDIRASVQDELVELNAAIARALDCGNPLMNQVISRYLRTRGKQLRPIMVLLTARLLGGPVSTAIDAAAAVELLHNASLIHDDVVDDSRQRHGMPTINAEWDSHIAVLVGDYFVSMGLELALSTHDPRICETIAKLGRLLSLGEMDQINTANQHSLLVDDYMEIISHKTASLFVACAEMGCFAADVDDWRLAAMRDFAELFGRAFQIKDDTFDYYDAGQIGKPTGNDLREGKVTLPLLYALSLKEHPDHRHMIELATKDNLDEGEIAQLIEFAKAAGGIDHAYQVMGEMREKGLEILSTLGDNEQTQALKLLFDYIIDRNH